MAHPPRRAGGAAAPRRILALWFPRLGAERLLRQARGTVDAPFATVAREGNMQRLASLSALAEAEGLRPGQPLRDAQAICPRLITRPADAAAEAGFLTALRRWAGKFSPWIAEEPPEGLLADLTGCAHLFGGEAALLVQVEQECAALGVTQRAGIADTLGAAWALARHAGRADGLAGQRSGDAIDQEARATRARAARRPGWARPGAGRAAGAAEAGGQALDAGPVGAGADSGIARRIAPPGQMHTALAPLPVAALRLPGETVEALSRLGLRRVGELTGMPRAALARRFGRQVVQRLDQALGAEPEPLGPAAPPLHFAARLSLPEPIGLEDDILAGIDRLLPALATRLREAGRGARRVGLEAHRADGSRTRVEVGLARATDDPARIRPLLAMKLAGIDAGFGIDMLRVEAVQTELLPRGQARAPLAAPSPREAATAAGGNAMDDLLGRLGARVGLEAITREHPASSHIPEKASKTLAAAWSEPAAGWPAPARARPLVHWRPEPVTAPESPTPPDRFRWRRRDLALAAATGPERIAPEWWLDEPDWRSGVRDYWRVTTATGERLWLYYAHGGTLSAGWFCQGSFA